MSYTKLFSEIVTSTIWSEDDKTRIIWITMLATANRHGEVMASVPGLAKIASVSVEDTRAAIEKLLSPDPDSRTEDCEGRRIEKIDGGWELINYVKYRKKLDEEDQRAANAERQRRYRERKRNKSVTESDDSNAGVPNSNDKQKQRAEAKGKEEEKVSAPTSPHPPDGGNSRRLAEEIYQAYPRKVGKPVALRAIEKALKKDHILDNFPGQTAKCLLKITQKYALARQGQNKGLTPHPATWFNQERYNDDPETWVDADTSKKNGNPNQVTMAPPTTKKVYSEREVLEQLESAERNSKS